MNLVLAIVWVLTAGGWCFTAVVSPFRSVRVAALVMCVVSGLLAAAYAGLWWWSP